MTWLYQPLLPASAELESGPPVNILTTAYWVGGSGTWDAIDTTNWAATSGGAGGAGVPNSTSTVIFNSNSNVGTGAFTVTVNSGSCNDLTISGLDGAMTLNVSSVLSIYGNTVLPATNLTVGGIGTIIFAATSSKTITSNGTVLGCSFVIFDGIGGTWQLLDNLSIGSGPSSLVTTLTNGTLNLNGYILSTGTFSSSNSNARTIAFGTGGIVLTSEFNDTIWNTGTVTNLTVTGTPTVTVTGTDSNNRIITTGTPTEANSISFVINNFDGTVSFSGSALTTVRNLTITNSVVTVNTSAVSIFRIFGNLDIKGSLPTISAGTQLWQFASTSGTKTITTSGKLLDFPVDFSGIGGTWALQDNLTVGATRGTSLNDGTLNLGRYTLSTGGFGSSSGTARTIAFGTGSINLTSVSTTTIWNTSTTTNLTVTGTPRVTTTGSGTTTKTLNIGAFSEANSISFELNNPAGTVAFTANSAVRNLTIGNNAITVSGSTLSIYGDLISGGTSPTLSFSTISFLASSGTKIIDLKGDSIGASVNFNGAATWQLLANITFFNTTLTAGTLDLNGFTVAVTQFLSSNSNVRGLLGPGTINVSYAPNDGGFMWTTSTSTNFSASGDIVVNTSLAFSDSDGTIATGTLSESNAISFVITASPSVFGINRIANGSRFKDLSIINNGQADPSLAAGNIITVYGNLSFSGPSFSSELLCNITLASTSGTKTITTNGLTVRTPLTFNGVGGTWQLVDNLTMISTAVTTLSNGTIDLNGKVFNVGTRLAILTGTKNITFNGGTLLCPAANTTSFNNSFPVNFTTTAGTGVGKISMSAAAAKTFVGGGAVYNCTLENAGAGALTISGSNTFNDITNSVQPTTFTFTAGTTTTVNNFSVSGTIGNVVTINSTGAAFTLSKSSGIVGVSSCTISNSTATGGATWRAFTGQDNVDGGNNTGWIFVGDVNIIFGNLVMSGGLTITYS